MSRQVFATRRPRRTRGTASGPATRYARRTATPSIPIAIKGIPLVVHASVIDDEKRASLPWLAGRDLLTDLGCIVDVANNTVSFTKLGLTDLPCVKAANGHLAVICDDWPEAGYPHAADVQTNTTPVTVWRAKKKGPPAGAYAAVDSRSPETDAREAHDAARYTPTRTSTKRATAAAEASSSGDRETCRLRDVKLIILLTSPRSAQSARASRPSARGLGPMVKAKARPGPGRNRRTPSDRRAVLEAWRRLILAIDWLTHLVREMQNKNSGTEELSNRFTTVLSMITASEARDSGVPTVSATSPGRTGAMTFFPVRPDQCEHPRASQARYGNQTGRYRECKECGSRWKGTDWRNPITGEIIPIFETTLPARPRPGASPPSAASWARSSNFSSSSPPPSAKAALSRKVKHEIDLEAAAPRARPVSDHHRMTDTEIISVDESESEDEWTPAESALHSEA